ncbi:MAG: prepilin-type N-terminal cleavage/methylation domain-containing protein [Deltaproteobacteria bacterium]|nr:prepilin-type N-terminal cleavage/methylation domain-containing protein [Deltaproteobacteria bacterium]
MRDAMRRGRGRWPSGTAGWPTLNERGYTLVEILIALAITTVLMASIYGLYNTFFKKTTEQDLLIEAQQNVRAGINMLEKELTLTGHNVPERTPLGATVTLIPTASASDVEFRYRNPIDNRRLKVSYRVNAATKALTRQACEQDDEWSTCVDPNWYTVIDNIDTSAAGGGLVFAYYDEDGNAMAAPVAAADVGKIRFIKITLTTKTKEVLAATGAAKSVVAETEVRLRNLYASSTGGDFVAPAQPTVLEVREDVVGGRTGVCGRLRLRWDKGAETDLAYYKIFYTLGAVQKSYRVLLSQLTVVGGTQYEATLAPGKDSTSGDWNLQHTPSDGSSIKTYTIGIRAYDSSHNASLLSNEVSGNPSPSRGTSTFGDGGANDTTVNPSKLPAVTGFYGVDGASDNKVVLNWTAYSATTYPDVSGFRIYRKSGSDFSSYPIMPGGGVDWIVSETGVAGSAFQYTDTSELGCYVYYYAIAPVNCDATLVTDDTGSDPADKKYGASDYAITYGDGAGPGVDSPSGSDTAPPDTTAPTAPGLGVRAGWKRVAVSLTQPSSADLDQTCVYVNPESSSYPAFLSSKDAYNCYQVDTSPMTGTPNAALVPDSGGVYTVSELSQGQPTAFWHDSMTQETPSQPSLVESGTYSYRAVSFDLCGNGSNPSQAQDTTTLCGEDPAVAAFPSNNVDHPKPPKVTNLAAACCDSDPVCCGAEPAGVVLSWTQVSSDLSQSSSPANPYDLAGYRVFRSTSSDFSSSTMISGSAPFWGGSFPDTGATDGSTYYYRVATTDCPYEKLNPNESTIKTDMIGNVIHSEVIGPVYPGRIQRDEKCPGAGSCTQDDHREVLTGVDIDGSNNSSPSGVTTAASPARITAWTADSYRHNSVTMFLRNTSADALTIQTMSISWVNSDAYLRTVTVGGGRSVMGATSRSISANPTSLTPTADDPYTRTLSDVDLSNIVVPASALYVPVTFEFKDDEGDPVVDMRDDRIRVTFNIKSGSGITLTTTCVSYLTVSQTLVGVTVPTGPIITATQQDQPVNPTTGYAVPGATGNNQVQSGVDGPVIADSMVQVKVSAVITTNTMNEQTQQRVDVTGVKLYYAVTPKTVVTAPDPSVYNYTEVTMLDNGGSPCAVPGTAVSGTCSGTIPAEDGYRVWSFIIATDADGNFDRDPEINHGAYVYDQKTFSVCSVWPAQPTWPANPVSKSGLDVTLTWNAVTTYSNGVAIQPGDSISYEVYRSDIGLITAGGCDSSPSISGTSCTDTVPGDGVYTYSVKAKNTCPNTGAASANETVCIGSTFGQAKITLGTSQIQQGLSYTITLIDCLAAESGHEGHLDYVNSASTDIAAGTTSLKNTATKNTGSTADDTIYYPPALTETGFKTATFQTTVQTSAAGGAGTLQVNSSDTINVTYPYASNSPQTITVVANPCLDIPDAPTSLSIPTQTDAQVTLRWTKPAASDLAGYEVWRKACKKDKPNCTGGDIQADWAVIDPAVVPSPITTSPVNKIVTPDQPGNFKNYIYYYKVKAYDTCSPTSNKSPYSNTVNETRS